ncbi:MAG TPA: cytochrome P450 [Actinocrinis sp.]
MDEPNAAEQFFLDAMSPQFREDPYPYYDARRSAQPFIRAHQSIWLAFSHADVSTLLRHPGLSTNEDRATLHLARSNPGSFREHSLLFMDPPDHTRLRALVSQAFTARRVQGLEATVEQITGELVDALKERAADGEPVDLISGLAYPLPVRVICALLGVPAEDEDAFTAWSRSVSRAIDPTILRSHEVDEEIAASLADLTAYLEDLLEQRRAAGPDAGDDLLSALVRVEADGDRVTPGEAISLARLLLVAGHETTVNLIGNGTLALLREPDQLALLRARPAVVDAAVDELLRYDSPVQLTQRIVVEDFEMRGHALAAGDQLALLLGAANRDPAVFADPARLDVTRDARRHVAFGGGIHFCLGAALAKLEGRVAFRRLVRVFPEMELAGKPVRRPTFTLRGLEELPVRLGI